jgi:hypothetical protein
VVLPWILCAATAVAQTAPQTPTPPPGTPSTAPAAVFKSTSALVLVDVIVSNPQGAVRGIPRGQFHLFEDGKEQKLIALVG